MASAVERRGKSGPERLRVLGVVWALAAGCGERDRLTFPTVDPGDGAGPTTEILRPSVEDTAVVEGDLVFVQGSTSDPDGVDSVYFELSGINQSYAPLHGNGENTVNFSLQFSTLNFTGPTVTVRAYGVDLLGTQGSVVTRRISLQ